MFYALQLRTLAQSTYMWGCWLLGSDSAVLISLPKWGHQPIGNRLAVKYRIRTFRRVTMVIIVGGCIYITGIKFDICQQSTLSLLPFGYSCKNCNYVFLSVSVCQMINSFKALSWNGRVDNQPRQFFARGLPTLEQTTSDMSAPIWLTVLTRPQVDISDVIFSGV